MRWFNCIEEGKHGVVVVPGLFCTEAKIGKYVFWFNHPVEFVDWKCEEFFFEAESFPDVAAEIFVDSFDYSVDGVVVFLYVPQSGCYL